MLYTYEPPDVESELIKIGRLPFICQMLGQAKYGSYWQFDKAVRMSFGIPPGTSYTDYIHFMHPESMYAMREAMGKIFASRGLTVQKPYYFSDFARKDITLLDIMDCTDGAKDHLHKMLVRA